jgi:hypothetical protein
LVTDLADSRACVDWAVSQIDILTAHIDAWYQTNPYALTTHFDSKRGKNAFGYEIRNPLPPIINAEVGAIINSIRSSLDILAVTLAKRCGATNVKKVYFPISQSAADFGKSGVKKIKQLSSEQKEIIEGLSPYKGGNDLLYALHQMDIIRKHRYLLTVHSDNIHFELSGTELDVVWPHELPIEERPEERCILAWVNPHATDCKAELSVEVTLARIDPLQPEAPAPALMEFATLAYKIIDLFEQ